MFREAGIPSAATLSDPLSEPLFNLPAVIESVDFKIKLELYYRNYLVFC